METDQDDQSGLTEDQKNMIPIELKPLPVDKHEKVCIYWLKQLFREG